MNIHDIVDKAGYIVERIRGKDDELSIKGVILRYGAYIDEKDWKEYSKAVSDWIVIEEEFEELMDDLKKLQKWMKEMGYDEDIEDDEEEME